MGRPPVAPTVETYRNARDLGQDDRLSEDLPFGSQGGLAVRHHFPVDGEYVVKVALQRNYVEYPRGIEYAHQLDVRLDGIHLQRFDIGGDAGSSNGKAAPLSYAGNIYGDPEWERWALHIDDDITVRFSTTAGGALRDPVVLEQQVRRMLADPRAKALVDNFAGQWLVLRNIRQAFPDPVAYPEFDESLRMALARESELFIEGQLREDRSVVDLLAADYPRTPIENGCCASRPAASSSRPARL